MPTTVKIKQPHATSSGKGGEGEHVDLVNIKTLTNINGRSTQYGHAVFLRRSNRRTTVYDSTGI